MTNQLAPAIRFRLFDSNGTAPLANGKIYTYEAGTTTPKTTYQTSDNIPTNTNPVILDSYGYADIWGSGFYKFVVKDSAGATLYTVDNIGMNSPYLGGDSNTIDNLSGTSVIAGGSDNQVSETLGAAILGGDTNTIEDSCQNSAIVAGQGNTISSGSSNAVIAGGQGNTVAIATNLGDNGAFVSGSGCVATADVTTAKGLNAKAIKVGQHAMSSGKYTTTGDLQSSELHLSARTTNATATEMTTAGYRLTIPTDTTWAFSILIVARRTDADNESAGYTLQGVIDNNAGTTALVGTVTKVVLAEDTAAWDVAGTADNTNDALIITVTGEAAKTILWSAHVRLAEVTG